MFIVCVVLSTREFGSFLNTRWKLSDELEFNCARFPCSINVTLAFNVNRKQLKSLQFDEPGSGESSLGCAGHPRSPEAPGHARRSSSQRNKSRRKIQHEARTTESKENKKCEVQANFQVWYFLNEICDLSMRVHFSDIIVYFYKLILLTF